MKNKLITLLNKLKNKLNNWNWRRIEAVFVLFLLLGMSFAIYQYYITNSSSSSPSKPPTSPQLNVNSKTKQYDLNNKQLKLSNKPKQNKKNKQAIKVNSDSPQTNFKNLVRPVSGEILSTSEWYHDEMLDAWKYNPGMNFQAEIGTPVKAVQAGKIKKINKDDFQGTTIIITHNKKYTTKYANLQKSKVKTGNRVTRGQIIGKVGDSGSSPNQLHFEIIKQENRISPAKYFN